MKVNDFPVTGLRTTELGLGCARFGSTLSPITRKQALTLVNEAFELGIRHFDTADIYGQGDSERLLCKALQGLRNEVIIATKGGQVFSTQQAFAARLKRPLRTLARHVPPVRDFISKRRARPLVTNFDTDYLEMALDRSLTRLGTNHIDIYYLHSPPVEVIETGVAAIKLDSFVKRGKIRAWGISCDTAEQAIAAVRQPGVRIVQMGFGSSHLETRILSLAAVNQVALVARPVRPHGHMDSGGFTRQLAALVSLKEITSVLVGTTNISHLRANIAACSGSIV